MLKPGGSPLTNRAMLVMFGVPLFVACLSTQQASYLIYAQQPAAHTSSESAALAGRVVDQSGSAVSSALVILECTATSGGAHTRQVSTDTAGYYAWRELAPGACKLWAQTDSKRSPVAQVSIAQGKSLEQRLVLAGQGSTPLTPAAEAKVSSEPAAFSDDPNFAVAGVTDWTAVGGHGSDATLRTSEELARTTQGLQAQETGAANEGESKEVEARMKAALAAAPTSYDATRSLGKFYLRSRRFAEAAPLLESASAMHHEQAEDEYLAALACQGIGDAQQAREHVRRSITRKETADADRLLGELEEQLGDPLSAVHHEERAALLNASEENYFAWGSELLLHRAVWQASQVFSRGAARYPGSARMFTGWGAALFANAMYDEASQRLCHASDLDPGNAETYTLMGKVEMASPAALPCIENKLAEHVKAKAEDPEASYLYAMCLQRQQGAAQEEVERLLRKAVLLKPDYAEAYLGLGILAFTRRDYVKAVEYYTDAVKADPTLAEAHYRLGVAYDRTGEKASAKREFETHAALAKEQADAVEMQRRSVKQFSVAAQAQAPGERNR